MIIKSHIRGGYRAASDYLKDQGQNEKVRLVAMSDPDAKTLDDAFHNMWVVACNSKVKKPLHHISINPSWDERLTDEQVLKIIERAEQKYGYKAGDHQRVIVEHIKDGRQHFHVMWNRVSLATGKAVWPGHHWKKSKQVAREMEKELGLKRPTPRRFKRMFTKAVYAGITYGKFERQRKSSFKPYKGGKVYKGKDGYRNNWASTNRTGKTTTSWRMSRVGRCSLHHARSSRYHPLSLKFGHKFYRATLPSKSAGTSYSLSSNFCNATGLERLPFLNPAPRTTFDQHLSLFISGGSGKMWHLPGCAGGDGASGSYVTVPPPIQATFGLFWKSLFTWNKEAKGEHYAAPFRPQARNMSLEQLVDCQAACDGKITWAEYFRKWGRGGGPIL